MKVFISHDGDVVVKSSLDYGVRYIDWDTFSIYDEVKPSRLLHLLYGIEYSCELEEG